MNPIILNKSGITIQGKKTVLLCASLFYFRIPRAEWEDRIVKLKESGYNCVDAYFPWNYHETAPGKWDFSGEKDVAAYLNLLAKHEMYVIARPGPYICSEWDGGALPAWVLTDPEMKIRENDSKYLAAVQQWYDHILPVLAAHQVGQGGTVVLMQLDNELDFYDCCNPRAYMEALRDITRTAGITVPLFGCAGQANVEGATGWADGVDISFNFYGNVCDPHFNEKFHYYAKRMEAFDRPLLVSETSCDHLLLRQELAAGAKLLGPYNQVGGTNFGFTGSTNNWGTRENPASFITTYYSGDNMIGPAGELRTQYFEGRCFAGLLHTFGEALASAESVIDEALTIPCSFQTNAVFYRLALADGGSLVCVPNLGEQDGTAHIQYHEIDAEVTVCAHDAPFYPMQVPLSLFGGCGTLCFANGELENAERKSGELVLTFWSESSTPYAKLEIAGKTLRLTEENPCVNGVRAVFVKKHALRSLPLAGVPTPKQQEETKISSADCLSKICASENLLVNLPYQTVPVQPLECLGVYRGMGSYGFSVKGQGLLLLGGSDIVSVCRHGFVKAYADAGATRWFSGSGYYEVLTAIWGHSNFADARKPALMLNSARGITGAVDVCAVQEMESNWFFSYSENCLPDSLRVPQRAVETMVSINTWNTTRTPLYAIYRKTVVLLPDCNSFVLQIKNPSAQTVVYVDGKRAELVNPLNPFVDLSAFLCGKKTAELELCVTKRDWNEPVGIPVLYSGRWIENCDFAPLPEKALTEIVQNCAANINCQLPLHLKPGSMTLVQLQLPTIPQQSMYLHIRGKSILAAVWAGDRLLGRVLNWEESPTMCGDPNLIYMPASYCEGAKSVSLLVTALDSDAELTCVKTEIPVLSKTVQQ
ncbi:MAG: beta-galactosidase [Oscillospiraceae bacterium]|nr:beta-galactosidase [Oscillospiraceae bacterium]